MASNDDPVLINPKGIKVRVPLSMAQELLKKGFRLADEQWTPEEEKKTFEKSVNINPKNIDTISI